MSAPTQAALSVHGVGIRFGGLQALDDVSFAVRPGELLGLIGPNGAGKTTCLRVIAGVLRADAGEVRLAGEPIGALPVNRRVARGLAMTNQIVRPLRSLTVLDNVALAWGQRAIRSLADAFVRSDRAAARAAAGAVLERVGIAEYAPRRIEGIPLGVLKRLEVARVLALAPRVALFDEPLAGLNHVEAARLADLIRSLTTDGLSVILIEHNLKEVGRVCDRLVVLETGRLLREGAPGTVLRDPEVIRAYVGEEAASAAA